MVNGSYMIVKFTSLQKLMDFVRACHVTSYELNVARMTLASHLQNEEMELALRYGATIIDGNSPQQLTKA